MQVLPGMWLALSSSTVAERGVAAFGGGVPGPGADRCFVDSRMCSIDADIDDIGSVEGPRGPAQDL